MRIGIRSAAICLSFALATFGHPVFAQSRPTKLGLEVVSVEKGALIERVMPGSAADLLGLKPGYTIVAMGSQSVRGAADIVEAERQTPIGLWHGLAYLVEGEMYLGLYTVTEEKSGRFLPPRGMIGVTLGDHNRGLRGARIDGVRRGGPAWQSGLQTGDLIVRAAGMDVLGADDVVHALANRSRQTVEITIYRRGRYLTGYVTPAAETQFGLLEVKSNEPQTAAIPSARGDGWCDQSGVRTVLCASAALVGVVIVLSVFSNGESRAPVEPTKDAKRRQERDRMQQDYERASDQAEIQRKALN